MCRNDACPNGQADLPSVPRLRHGQPVQAYADTAGAISALHWVPGLSPADPGPPLLISAAGSTLTIWLTDRAEPLHTYHAQGAIIALAWRRDRRVVAAGKQDASVQTWTFPAQSDLVMDGYSTKVRELTWDAGGRWLATGGSTVVTVWDWSAGTPEGSTPFSLDAHLDLVSALAFQYLGPYLASGGVDSRVYLWNIAQSEYPLAYSKLAAPISRVAWSPDDTLVAISADDGMVRVCRTLSEK
jgi:WD40 repeat protein